MLVGASASLGRPAKEHDMNGPSRKEAKSVTPELSKDNVDLIDKIGNRTVSEYIDELMQPHIDEYNEKQKRKDRKINVSYSEWHKLNEKKGDMVFSIVFQYGEHEDLGKKYYESADPEEKEKMRNEFIKVYKEWLKEFQTQFPNLDIVWASIHFDEVRGTPHLSTGIIPTNIKEPFKRGPKVQISMSKALEECGIARAKTRSEAEKDGFQLNRLFHKFREYQERTLIDLGYEIKPYQGGKHQDCERYNQLMEEATQTMKQAEQTMEQAEQQMEEATQTIKQANEEKKKVMQMQTFQNTLDELDNLITQDFDESQIKKVQVKDTLFGKTKTMVQMPEEQYNALLAESQSTTVLIEVEKKVEACKRVIQDHKNKMANTEQYYQHQINVLKDEIKERDSIIEGLKEKLEEAKDKIKRIFKFFEEHNLVQLYEQWKTKIMIQKEQNKVHFTTIIDDREQEHTITRK